MSPIGKPQPGEAGADAVAGIDEAKGQQSYVDDGDHSAAPSVQQTIVGRPQCRQCGGPLCSSARTGRKPVFCSARCRQAAYRSRNWSRRYQTPHPLRNEPAELLGSDDDGEDGEDEGA
jgi:hypothetical protein